MRGRPHEAVITCKMKQRNMHSNADASRCCLSEQTIAAQPELVPPRKHQTACTVPCKDAFLGAHTMHHCHHVDFMVTTHTSIGITQPPSPPPTQVTDHQPHNHTLSFAPCTLSSPSPCIKLLRRMPWAMLHRPTQMAYPCASFSCSAS